MGGRGAAQWVGVGAVALAGALAACRVEWGPPGAAAPGAAGEGPVEVWVYTSVYPEVLKTLEGPLAAAVPGARVVWFQAGSEKVAARFEAELAGGGSPACVLLTSDPAWLEDLSARGALRPYVSPGALGVDRRWLRPTWAAVRVSVMVLGGPAGGPAGWRDLADPKFRGAFSSGDPMASGTTFTTVAAWEQAFGAEFLPALAENGWMAAGGNSAVLARMESGERPHGVVLLENLLAKGLPYTVPVEGAVAVPGPAAIAAGCPQPAAAQAVVDWLFTPEAQALFVAGHMHSPLPGVAPPAGAPPLESLPLLAEPPGFWATLATDGPALKERVRRLRDAR